VHELVPPPATIAWLRDPRSPSFETEGRDVEPAAGELGRHLLSLNAESPSEIDAAFATMVQSRAGALLIGMSGSPSGVGSWPHSRHAMAYRRFPTFASLSWPAA
jgi:hypothetical protein